MTRKRSSLSFSIIKTASQPVFPHRSDARLNVIFVPPEEAVSKETLHAMIIGQVLLWKDGQVPTV